MIRAVVFDFFDVINTDPYNAWLKRHDLKREGPYREAADNLDHGRWGLGEFFERLKALSGHPIATMEQEWNQTKLVDGDIINLIQELKKHYKVGLLTNAPSDYVRTLIKLREIEELFDHITVSGEVGKIKPSQEAFDHILEKLGVTYNEAIFIDDSEPNVTAATKLGIHAIQFKDTKSLRHILERVL